MHYNASGRVADQASAFDPLTHHSSDHAQLVLALSLAEGGDTVMFHLFDIGQMGSRIAGRCRTWATRKPPDRFPPIAVIPNSLTGTFKQTVRFAAICWLS